MQLIYSFIRRRGDFFILLALILAIWLPRGLKLDQFVTTDEPLWLFRSANFYYALANGDLASTYQKEHPGVTAMWAGTAGFLLRYPEYKDSQRGQVTLESFHEYLGRRARTVTPLQLLQAGRTVMVLAHVLILALSFWYARRLLGLLPAALGFGLIAFDPFHLALTRLLHLDGLFSNLMLLSLLAFSAYLGDSRRRDLVLSAVAAGLGWLTKTPALFLIPTVGLLVVGQAWRQLWPAKSPRRLPALRMLWAQFWPLLAWFGLGAVVFVILWPSMWVHPVRTLSNVFLMAQQFAEEGHDSALFFNGQVVRGGSLDWLDFTFYPVTYLWRSTPAALAGLGLAVWAMAGRRRPFDYSGARRAAAGLVILVLIFLAGFTLAEKKFDRYLLPVYAPLDILAGMGWAGLAYALLASPNKAWRYSAAPLALLAVALQAGLALSAFPYYFTYYNPLLGGSRQAPEVMHIGWGEGLDQAGRYLNQKKDAQTLTAISWGSTGCLSYFFKGHDRSFWFDAASDADQWSRFQESDYAVIYINQVQAQIARPVLDYLAQLEPEHTIWLNGIRYADIYKIP